MKKILSIFFDKSRFIHRGVYGFTFLFVLLFAFKLQAQTYPVQISAQLVPPYSGYLPDYADPSAEKLKVILKFNDFSQPQYDIKLKFEIKGNGFTLSTKTFFNPPPITLIPGQPLLLSGNDLAPYLNANNLDFVGINQSQYQQRMSLPEGYYSICIKAYDYNNSTPIQLSNEACAQAWFTLSDPPYLNLPVCGSYLTPLNPQNIIFQWTPINLGSPLSALNTEYEFALYECRPDSNANPNQIVLSTAPIFSTTTQQTFINYGITEPPLNLYMKYVWRVRAKDITGRDLFKNQGYSQICTFTYGTLKNVLGNSIGITLTANEINHRSGECSFNKQSIYSNYLLQVRKKGTLNWFNFPNTTGYERVSNLEPSTTYECRVRGEQPMAGEWSNTAEFTTYAAPNYACNTNTMPVSPNATQPLPVNKAVLGMIIQSGQFEVIATEIKSNNIPGWYRGKGYAIVFGGFPVAVKWDNIFIDVDQKQQQGIIEAMTKGVEAWEHEHDLELAEEDPIEFGGTIDSIYISGGQVCCMLEGNATPSCVTLPENKNIVVVRDSKGNQYEINMVPPPPKITGPKSYLTISDDTLSASTNFQVVFEKSNTQKFGFDKRPLTSTSKDYEFIKLNDGASYFVPYKSIGEGGTDEVIATYSISNFDANKLEFRTMSGAVITKSLITNQFKLTGIPDNATCIYAYYDSKKIGKINIVSLKPISKKLMIVSVNGATLNQTVTAQEINKVYAQANVSWSVTAAPGITFDLGQDGLEGADANLLTKYSAEMRALRDAYKQAHADYDKEAYYVFVVPAFKDANLRGYMVRGRALGFVTASATVKEVTHELAHGAFGLEHTFPEVEKGSTTNLLDYGAGVDLNRGQWEEVQNPISINWMDDEEDASMYQSLLSSETLFMAHNFGNRNPYFDKAAILFADVLAKSSAYGIQFDRVNQFYTTVKAKMAFFGNEVNIEHTFYSFSSFDKDIDFLMAWGLNFYDLQVDLNSNWKQKIYYYLAKGEDKWSHSKNPPLAIDLIARVAMGVPNAIYGFATGKDPYDGHQLSAAEHALNLLEVVPSTGIGTKVLKGIKSIKVGQKVLDLSASTFSKAKEEIRLLAGKVVKGAGNITNVFFKNVDEFALTFDKSGAVSQTIRNQAFDLYKQGDWSELEKLFKSNNLNGMLPPANGGFNIIDDVDLKAGMKFDRYGGAVGNYNGIGVPNLGGSFTSPMPKGNAYSFGQRALNHTESTYDFYYEIEIMNDLPFKGQTADVIPWFNQVGGGKQTMWKIPIDPATGYQKTWNKLAQEGHVKITIKSSPSGKYNNLSGTIIN